MQHCVHVNKYLVEQPAQNKTSISNVKSQVETILMRQRKDRRLDILVCGCAGCIVMYMQLGWGQYQQFSNNVERPSWAAKMLHCTMGKFYQVEWPQNLIVDK